jgi:hypothetical protein
MWRKSSHSPNSNDCVEIGCGVGIRDSKAPDTHLPFNARAWGAFLHATKAQNFTSADPLKNS